jgi:site-specific DNA-methyltransferase (adenine-specific)
MSKTKLMLGDNILSLKKLPENSVDSIVTDPPYGLSFMGKKWDYDVPSVEFWKEVYRVLKPGGHILSFGGTRTYHRMVVNIEDAGFEIRDQVMWLYGSGFPKSHNIGKAVDKIEGNEREVVGSKGSYRDIRSGSLDAQLTEDRDRIEVLETKGQSKYEGWGTALKPANEPICVARKPLSEKTIADNVIKWGTGGINIDGCRIETTDNLTRDCLGLASADNEGWYRPCHDTATKQVFGSTEGRFPANLILDESAAELLDLQSSVLKGDKVFDSGGASRFFYVAKVSKKERNLGMERFTSIQKNTHPTVKPMNLMTYLCRLVTPVGGIVLDPFMGSGSTGIAAQLEGFRFVGMEMDPDYFKIAEARINSYEEYRKLLK